MTKLTKFRVLSSLGLVLGVFSVFMAMVSASTLARLFLSEYPSLWSKNPVYVAGMYISWLILGAVGFILWNRYGKKRDRLKAELGYPRERNISEPPPPK